MASAQVYSDGAAEIEILCSFDAARDRWDAEVYYYSFERAVGALPLPQAAAIVHPSLPGAEYPFRGLSGAGVAFKLAWAICQRASQAKRVSPALREFLLQAVALAALGTVADVVPLVDENRILVCNGLESLRQRPLLGLQQLLKVTELDKQSRLTSEDIGFSCSFC